MKLWCYGWNFGAQRTGVGSHGTGGCAVGLWRREVAATSSVESRHIFAPRLRVLCRPQSLNTERTEHLRDLSVEALEAPRSQRESVWLQPTVALSFLRGGRDGALAHSGERRERGPQPTQ